MNTLTESVRRSPSHRFQKLEPEVYISSNWKEFKLDKTNRPVNQSHVFDLIEAIERKNMLADFPILVDSNKVVLDGQHRLEAAKQLRLPIYYIIARDVTIDDIADTNRNTKSWSLNDSLHRFIELGNPNYIKLKAFLDKYSFIPISVARDLCHYGDRAGLKDKFNSGVYTFNDGEFAELVAQRLLDFKGVGFDHYSHRSFVNAIANLSANSEYDHDQMMQRLSYLAPKLTKCGDMEVYIALLNEIYNYRSHNKVWLQKLSSGDRRYRKDKKARRN